jgi:hypothetical protein
MRQNASGTAGTFPKESVCHYGAYEKRGEETLEETGGDFGLDKAGARWAE